MGEWQDRDPGPTCICGWPTFVVLREGGLPSLLCFGHTREAGAMFPLPKAKPENWPALSNKEMEALIEQGFKEHEDHDGGEAVPHHEG